MFIEGWQLTMLMVGSGIVGLIAGAFAMAYAVAGDKRKYWGGEFTHLEMYPNALNSEEIAALYEKGQATTKVDRVTTEEGNDD